MTMKYSLGSKGEKEQGLKRDGFSLLGSLQGLCSKSETDARHSETLTRAILKHTQVKRGRYVVQQEVLGENSLSVPLLILV